MITIDNTRNCNGLAAAAIEILLLEGPEPDMIPEVLDAVVDGDDPAPAGSGAVGEAGFVDAIPVVDPTVVGLLVDEVLVLCVEEEEASSFTPKPTRLSMFIEYLALVVEAYRSGPCQSRKLYTHSSGRRPRGATHQT